MTPAAADGSTMSTVDASLDWQARAQHTADPWKMNVLGVSKGLCVSTAVAGTRDARAAQLLNEADTSRFARGCASKPWASGELGGQLISPCALRGFRPCRVNTQNGRCSRE
jgi:hypothetical protein